jgi:glycolate oxidase iron-sulfur subunit
VINASGCGTTVKDYGHMFADDPQWKDKAGAWRASPATSAS